MFERQHLTVFVENYQRQLRIHMNHDSVYFKSIASDITSDGLHKLFDYYTNIAVSEFKEQIWRINEERFKESLEQSVKEHVASMIQYMHTNNLTETPFWELLRLFVGQLLGAYLNPSTINLIQVKPERVYGAVIALASLTTANSIIDDLADTSLFRGIQALNNVYDSVVSTAASVKEGTAIIADNTYNGFKGVIDLLRTNDNVDIPAEVDMYKQFLPIQHRHNDLFGKFLYYHFADKLYVFLGKNTLLSENMGMLLKKFGDAETVDEKRSALLNLHKFCTDYKRSIIIVHSGYDSTITNDYRNISVLKGGAKLTLKVVAKNDGITFVKAIDERSAEQIADLNFNFENPLLNDVYVNISNCSYKDTKMGEHHWDINYNCEVGIRDQPFNGLLRVKHGFSGLDEEVQFTENTSIEKAVMPAIDLSAYNKFSGMSIRDLVQMDILQIYRNFGILDQDNTIVNQSAIQQLRTKADDFNGQLSKLSTDIKDCYTQLSALYKKAETITMKIDKVPVNEQIKRLENKRRELLNSYSVWKDDFNRQIYENDLWQQTMVVNEVKKNSNSVLRNTELLSQFQKLFDAQATYKQLSKEIDTAILNASNEVYSSGITIDVSLLDKSDDDGSDDIPVVDEQVAVNEDIPVMNNDNNEQLPTSDISSIMYEQLSAVMNNNIPFVYEQVPVMDNDEDVLPTQTLEKYRNGLKGYLDALQETGITEHSKSIKEYREKFDEQITRLHEIMKMLSEKKYNDINSTSTILYHQFSELQANITSFSTQTINQKANINEFNNTLKNIDELMDEYNKLTFLEHEDIDLIQYAKSILSTSNSATVTEDLRWIQDGPLLARLTNMTMAIFYQKIGLNYTGNEMFLSINDTLAIFKAVLPDKDSLDVVYLPPNHIPMYGMLFLVVFSYCAPFVLSKLVRTNIDKANTPDMISDSITYYSLTIMGYFEKYVETLKAIKIEHVPQRLFAEFPYRDEMKRLYDLIEEDIKNETIPDLLIDATAFSDSDKKIIYALACMCGLHCFFFNERNKSKRLKKIMEHAKLSNIVTRYDKMAQTRLENFMKELNTLRILIAMFLHHVCELRPMGYVPMQLWSENNETTFTIPLTKTKVNSHIKYDNTGQYDDARRYYDYNLITNNLLPVQFNKHEILEFTLIQDELTTRHQVNQVKYVCESSIQKFIDHNEDINTSAVLDSKTKFIPDIPDSISTAPAPIAEDDDSTSDTSSSSSDDDDNVIYSVEKDDNFI